MSEFQTNSEGKQFKYEKNNVFYGGDYLEELPKEIDLEKPANEITEESQEVALEQKELEIQKIDEQIQEEESGLKEARENLGLNPKEGESSIAVQTLKEEKQKLTASEEIDSKKIMSAEDLIKDNDPETTYILQKSREFLRRGEETAEEAAERLRSQGRAHEAEIMLIAGRQEKLKQIDLIAEELKTIIEKSASDSGSVPLQEIMDGIDSVLNSQETTEDFTDLEVYFGNSVDIASIKKSVFQMAYVGNEKGAVKLLAFAKKKLQG